MSQYLEFFSEKNGQFVCIGTYSRSTDIYQIFASAPYEHVTCLTNEKIMDAIHSCNCTIESLVKDKELIKEKIAEVRKMENNTIEEKTDQIDVYYTHIAQMKEMIENNERAKAFCNFMDVARECAEDDGGHIYYGIEVGYDVSMEDVV